MDLNLTPEEEAYREQVRAWLANNRPVALHQRGVVDGKTWVERAKDWQRRLYEGGLLALSWPREYGGQALDPMRQAIVSEELARANVGGVVGGNAIGMLGPTLITWGTEEQKRRYLPKILTGEEIWCQGYSEPGAGSDLASLRTRAELAGDEFVVNGQKVWTSGAHIADMMFGLVRTNPDAPKHKGISYLLIDMKSPGITVRPLVQITGEAGFNEVFYDNVRVPKENLVGELNQGWQVSIATLMYERVSGGTRHPVQRTISELLNLSRHIEFEGIPANRHPYVRQKLAQFAIEAECLRLSRYRSLTSQLKGKVPGPESSFGKLFATELNLRVAMFADELLGMSGIIEKGSPGCIEGGRWLQRTLAARGLTIAAGSSEIQHNIIGERVLKLPKG